MAQGHCTVHSFISCEILFHAKTHMCSQVPSLNGRGGLRERLLRCCHCGGPPSISPHSSVPMPGRPWASLNAVPRTALSAQQALN